MKGALWSFVSAFAVMLQGAADIPIQSDLDISKLQGKWHSTALVLDRGEPKSTMGSVTRMVPAANGDLMITNMIPRGKRCKKEKVRLLRTEESGKFKTKAQSILRVVETDYKTYCIHHVETRQALVNALHLYTRKPDVSDDVKEKFKTIASNLGFSEDNIIYQSKPGKLDVFQARS